MAVAIGIDFGTSGARLVAIDTDRNILHGQSQDWQESSLDYGNLPGLWRQSLWQLLGQLPGELKPQVCAIAIDGTSSTVLLCDRSGQPILAPLLYHDDRAKLLSPECLDFIPNGSITRSATSSLAKLLWYAQQPNFATGAYFLHQADWLAALLHGQWGISDYHNALKLGYDCQRLCYPNWLEQSSYRPILPQVMAPGEPIGSILPAVAGELGLDPDCTIVAGTTDSIGAFLACGQGEPGVGVTSLGSTLAIKLLSTQPVENLSAGVYSHRLGNLWLVGGASNTGGAVLRHYFSDVELQSLSDRIDLGVPCNLDYYPLLSTGDRFPINDPHLPPRLKPKPTDDAEFLYGLLSGMARIEAMGYRVLAELGATNLSRVYTAGGGAKNAVWTQIRQHHLQVPISTSDRTEAAYGTALLALGAISK
jgi:D-ribulokinase